MTKTIPLWEDPAYKGALPSDFQHGYATAANQVEGASNVDGRSDSIWDVALSDKKRFNFDYTIQCDSYNRWEDDIVLLKQYGANTYKFSLSWPRIIPKGGANDPVNEKGLEYYDRLIDGLLAAGIEPVITLHHYDIPFALEQKYKGWTCDDPHQVVRDFVRYARVCFERFSGKVRYWSTHNEPWVFMVTSSQFTKPRYETTDFYKIYFRLMLAHAETVKIFRASYAKPNSEIGIVLNLDWAEPIDDSPAAKQAASSAYQRVISLFADPLYRGVENQVAYESLAYGHRRFTEDEMNLIRGSTDFFGLNLYGTAWVDRQLDNPLERDENGDWLSIIGGGVVRHFEKDGVPIGKRAKNGHPYMAPWGFRKSLVKCYEDYAREAGQTIRVFENGYAVDGEETLPVEQALKDEERSEFYEGNLRALCDAVVHDGVKVGTFTAWSLLDNLEWQNGYEPRFGVTWVDPVTQDRKPKESAGTLIKIFRHIVAS